MLYGACGMEKEREGEGRSLGCLRIEITITGRIMTK